MYPFTPTNPPRLVTRSPSPTAIEYTVTTAPIPPASALSRYALLLLEASARVGIVAAWLVLGAVKYRDEALGLCGGSEGGTSRWARRRGFEAGVRWLSIFIGIIGAADDVGGGAAPAPAQGGGMGVGMGMHVLGWARWVDWWVVIAGGVFCAWVAGQKGYTEESLLILRNLGIQTRTCPSSTFSLVFFLAPIASLLAPLVLPPLRLLAAPFSHHLLASSHSHSHSHSHAQSLQGQTNPNPPPPPAAPFYSSLLSSSSSSSSSYTPRGTTRFIPTSHIQDVWIHEGFVGFEVRYFLGVVVKGEGEIVVVFPKTLPGRRVAEVVWRGLRGCLYEGCEAKT